MFQSRNVKARLARMSLLQGYDMEIEHVKGLETPSDNLSKRMFNINKIEEAENEVDLVKVHHELGHGSVKAMEYQLKGNKIANLR